MLQLLNKTEIDSFLKAQTIGRIGCHADGKIYVVPTSFVYENGNFYCHGHEGMKMTMMRQNPSVCFEVDAFVHPFTWQSVIAWGNFEEITDVAERSKILEIMLFNKLPVLSSQALKIELGVDYPFAPFDLADIKGSVFKINITEKTGRREMNKDYKAF